MDAGVEADFSPVDLQHLIVELAEARDQPLRQLTWDLLLHAAENLVGGADGELGDAATEVREEGEALHEGKTR
jgi:hypothetical protein